MSDERATVPCCGYQAKLNNYPVMWNPFNKVVQCHNCGQVWEPKELSPSPQPATRAALGTPAMRQRDGALQIEPPDKLTGDSVSATPGEITNSTVAGHPLPDTSSTTRTPPLQGRAVTGESCIDRSVAARPIAVEATGW